MHYERIGKYSVEEILPWIANPGEMGLTPPEREFSGVLVRLTSIRYKVFKKSITCAHCGLQGQFFALERHARGNSGKYHFNLYGYDALGEEVMLTKDHILAKARGGTDSLHNLQTLCRICNEQKADKFVSSIKFPGSSIG